MKPTAIIAILSVFVCLSFSNCKKQADTNTATLSQTVSSRITPENVTVNAHGICDYVLDEAALTATGWTKIFEDDFTGDLSKWNIWTGGAFNNELQYYQGANLQVTNGNLVITAKKETVTGATTPFDPTPKTFNYTSGRVECKTNVSSSASTPRVRMIARIRLPAGYGMWPAYWSYGDPWPTQGEIDFLEARGQEPTKYQTNYFYGKAANHNIVKNAVGFINTDGDLTTCYHVYEMIWAQNTLSSYFDGALVETKSGGNIPNLFGKTEHITLNLAVGGNFFTNFNPAQIQTGTMYVDYVKVFKSN